MRSWLAANALAEPFKCRSCSKYRCKYNVKRKLQCRTTKHECLQRRCPLIKHVQYFDEPNFSYSHIEHGPLSYARGALGPSSVGMQFNTGSDTWRLQIRSCLLSFVHMLGVDNARREGGVKPLSKPYNLTGVLMGYMTAFDRWEIGGVEGGRLPMAPDSNFDDLMKQIQCYLDDVEAEQKQEESRA